jgi:hypothetical protein
MTLKYTEYTLIWLAISIYIYANKKHPNLFHKYGIEGLYAFLKGLFVEKK